MTKKGLLIFILITGWRVINAQNPDSICWSWDKIVIYDGYSGWFNFDNTFELKKNQDGFILVNERDSVLNTIDSVVLESFFKALSSKYDVVKEPLKLIGRDSAWLINHAEQLWEEYSRDRNEPEEVDSFAIETIKNYDQIKTIVWSMFGRSWTDDYPYVEVLVIKGLDTLKISSIGQYPLMMPWTVNNKVHCNSELPRSIAKMLPSGIDSNKKRLSGDGIESHFMNHVYNSLIQPKSNYIEVMNRFPRSMEKLKKRFSIEKAQVADMGSIEWGGFISAPCLELSLESAKLPDHVTISAIFGKRMFLHSVKPLVRKEEKIFNQLSTNRVFQYTLANANTRGEIHFVNRRSLSWLAKWNFKSELKYLGMKRNQFNGHYRSAIFYELKEKRNDGASFSRWIFLKDGTYILWQLRGNYLMNLSSEITEENGYICKIINEADFH